MWWCLKRLEKLLIFHQCVDVYSKLKKSEKNYRRKGTYIYKNSASYLWLLMIQVYWRSFYFFSNETIYYVILLINHQIMHHEMMKWRYDETFLKLIFIWCRVIVNCWVTWVYFHMEIMWKKEIITNFLTDHDIMSILLLLVDK